MKTDNGALLAFGAVGALAGLAALGSTRGSRKLEGWERMGELPSVRDLHRVSRGLYSSRAEQIYGKRLRTARLPLYVVVADLQPGTSATRVYDRTEELAAEGYTVLLVARPLERAFGLHPEHPALKIGRGEPGRIAAMTPFTLLHRMGDVMRNERWSSTLMRDITWMNDKWRTGWLDGSVFGVDYKDKSREEEAVMASTGVDTVAGRNGWLSSAGEAVSDLWAKYLLTGGIAYDPDAQPSGGHWGPKEMSVRRDMAERMSKVFPKLLEDAKGKVLTVVE